MEKLKKVISLAQAARMTGYNQDYLGSLVRKGEIRAKKVGRSWFTTEGEINDFMFRQKIRHREFAVAGFFSRRRARNIALAVIVFFFVCFSVGAYVSDMKTEAGVPQVQQVLGAENKIIASGEAVSLGEIQP